MTEPPSELPIQNDREKHEFRIPLDAIESFGVSVTQLQQQRYMMFTDELTQEQQAKFIRTMEYSLFNAAVMGAFYYHVSQNLDEITDAVRPFIDSEHLQDLQLRDVVANLPFEVEPEKAGQFLRTLLDHFIHEPHSDKVMDVLQECLANQSLMSTSDSFNSIMRGRLIELQSEVETQH